MGYNLKRVKMVSKKDYNTRAFGSKFCIDEKGSLYIYTKEDRISRVDLDRTVEDFLLPDFLWANNVDALCYAPIVVKDGLFHIRYGEKGYYILKTDLDMKELYRVSLEEGFSRKQFWCDNHFYFTVKRKRSCQGNTVLVKMDTNGTICWEYSMETEDISDFEVVPLSGGRVLVPIKKDYEIYKFHVIDTDGKLLYQINDIKLENNKGGGKVNVIKGNIENTIIYAECNPLPEKADYVFTTVIDKDGMEIKRGLIKLVIKEPFLFIDGRYLYDDLYEYSSNGVIKTDITNENQKVFLIQNEWVSTIGSYVDEKLYICQSGEKQSWLTCLDKEEKELWQFTTKERILLFEVKGDYLYFTTKNKICIYRIEEE